MADPGSSHPCILCNTQTVSLRNYSEHCNGKKHKNKYRNRRSHLLREHNHIKIENAVYMDGKIWNGEIKIEGHQTCVSLEISLHNVSSSDVTLKHCVALADPLHAYICTTRGVTASKTHTVQALKKAPNFEEATDTVVRCPIPSSVIPPEGTLMPDMERVTGNPIQDILIKAGSRITCSVSLSPDQPGEKRIPILFSFCSTDAASFLTACEIVFNHTRDVELHTELAPKKEYRNKSNIKQRAKYTSTRAGLKLTKESKDELAQVGYMAKYEIPETVMDIMKSSKPDEDKAKELLLQTSDTLTFENYSEHFNNLLYAEEYQLQLEMDGFRQWNVPLNAVPDSDLLRVKVKGLAEKRPSILVGDCVNATIIAPEYEKDEVRYEGQVHKAGQKYIDVGFCGRLLRKVKVNPALRFEIAFSLHRREIRLQHAATTWCGSEKNALKDVLFPVAARSPKQVPEINRFFNKDIKSNPEQRAAVEHIVAGTSHPAPYLLFGPPGTGKTTTVVEAILQVKVELIESRILVCTPSNTAADVITQRLLNEVPSHQMLRLNATSRSLEGTSQKFKDVCNKDPKENVLYFPSKEELQEYRIVITTLMTSGRLGAGRVSKHFTHIFIDEAGHASEPEALVGISHLMDSTKCQLVLAGDPYQLGAVISSKLAQRFGLGRSLLERLMDLTMYKKSVETGCYNMMYVTKLLKCLRSHQMIIDVPNHCFYEGELQACASKQDSDRFCEWQTLGKPHFPVIFHGVNGKEARESSNPSWFNVHEIEVMMTYIKQLHCEGLVKPCDVGIISPYRKQVLKIQDAFKKEHHLKDVKVGSVDIFQGEERAVIIISTVRSRDDLLKDDAKRSLGFLNNPKRFNVAITRAKSLLIVIGNPFVLQTDPHWNRFIEFCWENGGCKGSPPEVEKPLASQEQSSSDKDKKVALRNVVQQAKAPVNRRSYKTCEVVSHRVKRHRTRPNNKVHKTQDSNSVDKNSVIVIDVANSLPVINDLDTRKSMTNENSYQLFSVPCGHIENAKDLTEQHTAGNKRVDRKKRVSGKVKQIAHKPAITLENNDSITHTETVVSYAGARAAQKIKKVRKKKLSRARGQYCDNDGITLEPLDSSSKRDRVTQKTLVIPCKLPLAEDNHIPWEPVLLNDIRSIEVADTPVTRLFPGMKLI